MSLTLSLDQVAHVIALATAPAFLIGSVVSFLILLIGRMARVLDRAKELRGDGQSEEGRVQAPAIMRNLRRRANLIHVSIILAIGSGIMTAMVIVVAFLGALTEYNVEVAVAAMFVATLLLFLAALWLLAHEAVISLGEIKHEL